MTQFWKLSGGGNDFIALAEPPGASVSRKRIESWCKRGLSVGADGLFTLSREPDGRVRMAHFNPDGGRASLCLNGTRCAARLAFHLGWASAETKLITDAGEVGASDAEDAGIRLELPPPDSPPKEVSLKVGTKVYQGWWTKVGVPHLVLFLDEGVSRAPVDEVGRDLVHHPELGAEGANINFVYVPNAGKLEIRTYERGVNGETLACGTGVLSSCFGALSTGRAVLPMRALTAGGFELLVEGKMNGGRLDSWSLTGDARLIAEGRIHPGAEELPASPAWTGGTLATPAF